MSYSETWAGIICWLRGRYLLKGAFFGQLASLDVRSRHVVDGINVESLRLLCPELANVFEGREPFKCLEPLGEVVGGEEGLQVSA